MRGRVGADGDPAKFLLRHHLAAARLPDRAVFGHVHDVVAGDFRFYCHNVHFNLVSRLFQPASP
jgi:hypothetical protein